MCNIKANENPELLKKNGWELVKKMLETTIISRRHPFAPKAGDDKNSAVNGICLDFNGKGSQEALTEAANNIKKKIADDKAIWGE
jgi:hypothetical protein